jgi:hypothetical protein
VLLVVGTVMAPRAAAAQGGAGFLVGFSSANVDFSSEGFDVSADSRNGFVGGLTFTRLVQNALGYEVDALVTMKGTSFDFPGEGTAKLRVTYLDIPVMARAAIPIAPATRVNLFAGPSFNFKLTSSSEPDEGDENVKPFEFGLVVGGGVTVARFRIDVRYGWGLSNIADDSDDEFTAKNRAFMFLVGMEP